MKLLPFLVLPLIACSVSAQSPVTLSGKVSDKTTGEGLPYATIQLVGTSIGTSTNGAGEFVFRIPSATPNPVVAFSYLGYQSVRLKDFTSDQQRLSIALAPDRVILKEVVVRPVDPWQVISRSLEKLAQNYPAGPYQAEGFQREVVTADRNVIQLLEVAFRTVGSKESHATTVLDARYLEDKEAKAPLWNPSRGGFYAFGWTNVSGIDSPDGLTFLGVDLKKQSDLNRYYTFVFREMITRDAKEVYVIDFDQKKQVRKPLLTGTLYIDAESYAIVKIEQQLSRHGLPFLKPHQTWGGLTISQSPKRLTVQQDRWVTTYRQFGQKWYLNSLVVDTDFSASLVFMGLVQARKDSLRLHSERVVTTIDTTIGPVSGAVTNITEVGTPPTLQNFVKKEYENRATSWADLNYIQSDTALAGLARQLRSRNEQWDLAVRKRSAGKLMASRAYSVGQLTEDLAYLQESLEKLHPGLDWYTDKSSLAQSFSQLKKQLTKTTSEAEFFRMLGPLIEQIHCGHTELYPSAATQEHQALFPKRFPLDLRISGDSSLVAGDYEGIPRGSTVISVNGNDQVATVRRIRSVLPSDGHNQTYKTFRLQHEFPALYARYVQSADTFEVKIRDPDRQIRTVRMAGRETAAANDGYATARIHDSLQTLVLQIPSFATTQDFPGFLNETFRKIAERRITSLVIDLRNNQGGRDEYGALLYAYLADRPFRYYHLVSVATADSSLLNRLTVGGLPLLHVLPDYLSGIRRTDGVYAYTQHSNLSLQQPRQNAFRGPVYLLINGGTFSSAAEFAAIARSHKRGTFIGQEAGGGYYGNCSLATPLLTLPNSGIRLAMPLGRYEMAVSPVEAAGHGVIPDHATNYRAEDLILNRDIEMERCFDLIRKTKN